ncbi:MAG TPA: PAS domain S-box protein, partial [Candidatus Limnocylindrales bacterium]|nr:PAS domain S-box protein [Candidatus Limnocylindrales bacterium]
MAAQKKDKPDLTAEKHRQSFDARELRAANQRSALARLATEPALSSGDLVAAAQALTEIASSAIAVARISIWLLTDDGEELKCLDLYEPARPQHSSGLILRASDYPGYFDAVLRESRVYADDTFTDRRTVEFIENYLKPLGITSMLDAGIFAEGKLLGVFCFEHVGEIRHWHIDEESFASTIAALSAQVLENIRRRKVEQELRESQEKYKGLFQNSADAQFVMNTEFVDCNVEACRLLGHKYEELIGHSPLDFSPPLQPDGRKSAEAASEYIDLALKGRPQTFYWQHQHKDGSLLDTEVRLHRVVVDDHKMLMASVRDISERKQAERIIAHGRDWYRALAEDIPVLVTRISADGRITFVNEASRAFFGRPLKELVGQGFFNLVPPEYRAEVEEKFASLIPEEPTVTYEHFKQSRLFGWKNRAIFNPDRTLKEYLAVGEDITERRATRNALQYQLQCEQLVAEISSTFVNTRSEKINDAINLALKRSGEFFGADCCYLMRFSADQQYIVNPYEWCAEGVSSVRERNDGLPVANTPWWANQLLSKNYVYIPDVDEMPPEAEADKIDFKIEEIKSILTIPVIRGGEVFAFLGLDEVKSKKTWTEQQIALLRTVAEIISETLLKHEAEEALKDSEERYREILATIEEAYYEADLAGSMTFCNEAT